MLNFKRSLFRVSSFALFCKRFCLPPNIKPPTNPYYSILKHSQRPKFPPPSRLHQKNPAEKFLAKTHSTLHVMSCDSSAITTGWHFVRTLLLRNENAKIFQIEFICLFTGGNLITFLARHVRASLAALKQRWGGIFARIFILLFFFVFGSESSSRCAYDNDDFGNGCKPLVEWCYFEDVACWFVDYLLGGFT